MEQIDKLVARINSLDDGLSTITFYRKGGEIIFWVVDTKKAEGDKIESRREVSHELEKVD